MFSIGLILAPVVEAGLGFMSRDRLPQTSGTLRFSGLTGKVEVRRDSLGIPHIAAQNLADLLFAQGYVHAQDRLWQMDFNRRLVAGRLAEVLGSAALPVDRWIRVLGLRRVAEQEPALMDGETRACLEAYVAGVNARIDQGHRPVEFKVLGYHPEPWTLVDSLSWSKMMAWMLSGNWESELLRAELITRLGAEQAGELELEDLQPWPNGMDSILSGYEALDRSGAARAFTGPDLYDGVGSNSWVISGSRTASGSPILANDMHLHLGAPAIWYENHLQAGDLDVTGVTFPGVPFVIAGHNQEVAWGFTAGFADVQDLYMEHLKRAPGGDILVECQGEWRPAEVRLEEIRVRGGPAVFEEVVTTQHGPVINPLIHNFQEQEQLALRWTSLEPDQGIKSLIGINRSRSCQEFREALRDWPGPVLNVVYADTAGNIAYSLAGKVPRRLEGEGTVPAPGWTGTHEWMGWIPFDELPHLYNPPQGYIVTANNCVADRSYPYFLGCDFVIGDRARRIAALIGAQEKHTIAGVQEMQFDQVSLSARWVAHYLGKLRVDDPYLAEVVALMRDWDATLGVDSPAATIHEIFMGRVIPLMLRDKLGDLTERYAGKGPTPLLAEGSMWGFRSWEWFQRALTIPDSHWFDLGNGETRDDVLRIALRETIDYLKIRLGPVPADWTWGSLHRLTFAHILGQVKPLDHFFNRGPYPVGGDGTTVSATYVSLTDAEGKDIVGPPFRFIADLADLDHSLGLLAPGQSGHPGSPHYDDQVPAWFERSYHTMLYDRAEVEAETADRLVLLPAG